MYTDAQMERSSDIVKQLGLQTSWAAFPSHTRSYRGTETFQKLWLFWCHHVGDEEERDE
jgi:hypothetical protein